MRALVLVMLAGCFPAMRSAPPPQQQPQQAGGSGSMCKTRVDMAVTAYCNTTPTPMPPGWAERVDGAYDKLAKDCPADVLAPLAACKADLDARLAKQDPDAKARRERERPAVDSLAGSDKYKDAIARWHHTLDDMKVACNERTMSSLHEKNCKEHEARLDDVETGLRKLLHDTGIDGRDWEVLGLWPHDGG